MLVLPSLPTQECGSGVPWGPVQPISHDTWLPFTPTHTPGSSLAPEKIPTAHAEMALFAPTTTMLPISQFGPHPGKYTIGPILR